MKIPREGSAISLLNCYLDINFALLKKTDSSTYVNGKDIRLIDLGPVALFSKFKLTTSSATQLEDINHVIIVFYCTN